MLFFVLFANNATPELALVCPKVSLIGTNWPLLTPITSVPLTCMLSLSCFLFIAASPPDRFTRVFQDSIERGARLSMPVIIIEFLTHNFFIYDTGHLIVLSLFSILVFHLIFCPVSVIYVG